jgi:hypothetical protein
MESQLSSDFNTLSLASMGAASLLSALGQVQMVFFLPQMEQSPSQASLHNCTVGIWKRNS